MSTEETYQTAAENAAAQRRRVLDGKLKGLPVKGYQPQPQVSIHHVNLNKMDEEELLRKLDAMPSMPGLEDIDKRWLAVARTHFEQGFMALNRAIFRPGRVRLPGDPSE